jgi:hypothetical protein
MTQDISVSSEASLNHQTDNICDNIEISDIHTETVSEANFKHRAR